MSTGIEWTDETWNPVTGCREVSPGCKNCYAKRLWPKVEGARVAREGGEPRSFHDVQVHPDRLDAPLRLIAPKMIFVNSMSDLFHESIPFQFIADVFAIMACTTRHRYQVLTKRPDRMAAFFKWLQPDAVFRFPKQIDPLKVWPQWTPCRGSRGGYDNCGPAWPLVNVWLGVSCENKAAADERIPLLLKIPAAVRFISAEPLLGPISFEGMFASEISCDGTNALEALDWVIAGGESGPKARPSHPDWFRLLRDQCQRAEVPFFFKQWGEWQPGEHGAAVSIQRWCEFPDGETQPRGLRLFGDEAAQKVQLMARTGKRVAGRLLDGREWDEYPR